MNYLTPLEQTTAGKQIFGKGELVGKIRTAQKVLRPPVSSHDLLLAKSHEELSVLVQQLEAESGKFVMPLN